MQEKMIIRGARQHNLKNISLEIPREKLVIAGDSAGKTGSDHRLVRQRQELSGL